MELTLAICMGTRITMRYQLYCTGTNASLRYCLLSAKFFSLQADGSRNVENEIFTVQFFMQGKVHETTCNVVGLFKCLKAAMGFVGIDESE